MMMQGREVVGGTAAGCAALALAVTATGVMAGHTELGLAVAVGLLLGAGNGWAAGRSLNWPLGFRSVSMLRLLVLTVTGTGAAALISLAAIPFVMLGLGLSQLLLAAMAVRASIQGVRT
ncbi:MAG: hypothetical protein M3024_16590 [Candidatus Dormibacteraeota bacterium]|nr:hypothetical protein [Candidatus Dormibacteraeota bacterium]